MSVLEHRELWIRIDDPIHGSVLVCLDGEAVLGRDLRCDVVIHDEEASRCHARLAPTSGRRWKVVDLDTTNGTFVNSARIVGTVEVGIGDAIRLGRVSCEIVDPLPR